jgi:hypothetical protein
MSHGILQGTWAEREQYHKRLCVLGALLVVGVDGRRVDTDGLGGDDIADLQTPNSQGDLARAVGKTSTHTLLELGEVLRSQSVGFGDHGDKVDTSAEALHDLDVQGLKAVCRVERGG